MTLNQYGPLDKVSKAGDTMTGPLVMNGSPPLTVASGAGSGKVLTSDSSGNATWQAASAAGLVPMTIQGQQQLAAQRAAILQGWHAGLANRHYARCNIACIGDSITEGQGATDMDRRWIARLRDLLRARFPVTGLSGGGRGFIPAAYTGEGTFSVPVSSSGSPAQTSFPTIGPKQSALQLLSGQSVTWTLYGDSADIMWWRQSFGSSFTYAVDGGSAVSVNTSGTNLDGQVTHVSLGQPGTHTLVCAGTNATFSAVVDGVTEYNGDYSAGIQVQDCGHTGSTSGSWLSFSTSAVDWPAAIAALTPALVIIALGANDYSAQTVPATYQSNLATFLTTIRSAMTVPYPPVIFAMFAARGDVSSPTYPWSQYVTAAWNEAAADGASTVLDLTLGPRMPAQNASPNWGLYYDQVHPDDKGHSFIAEYLASFLAPA